MSYKMNSLAYTHNGQFWFPNRTTPDHNSFFHAAFGGKTKDDETYFDKHSKFRRLRWATFLTYYENESMPLGLVDILRECFSSNVKHYRGSIEDKHALENYISDILNTQRHVSIEEIPILATLENTRVVVLSNGRPDPLLVAEPNPEILGDYTNAQKPKGEVVLGLEGSIFRRLDAVPKYEESETNALDTNHIERINSGWIKYEKLGTAGIKGIEYQVGILAVFLLNSLRQLKDWMLSTENTVAGKFDDVVLEWPQGCILLQTKHKEKDTNITLKNLLSDNPKNDDFSVPKYFLSYQEIKDKFKLKNPTLVICTNAGMDKDISKYLQRKTVTSDNMLFYGHGDCEFYTFNQEILDSLRKGIITYITKSKKSVSDSLITDENLKDFLSRLQLYYSYPKGNDINSVVDRLLLLTKESIPSCTQMSCTELYAKVMAWFKHIPGVFLNDTSSRTLFSEIWRDRRWQTLEDYNIGFTRNDLNLPDAKRIFHFRAGDAHLLQELRIYAALSNNTKMLYVCSQHSPEMQTQVVEAFELPPYTLLLVVLPKTKDNRLMREMGGRLEDILNKYQYKKVIFVGGKDELLPFSKDLHVVNETVTWGDLSKETRDRLLKRRNVIFQGDRVSLEELLTENDYDRIIHSEVLEKVIRDEQIKVGEAPTDLRGDISHLYVNRKFERAIEEKVETISEDVIYETPDKVVLISDQAGTGKTTVLTNLAVRIKRGHPDLWVIRVELNRYTRVLKDACERKPQSIRIQELLNSKPATKLTSQLEKDIFSLHDKVVLMMDGVDEVSPDYKDLVVKLLVQCEKKENFAKIFVTTRPHLTKELTEKLKTEPFVLLRFTEEDQIAFLTNYWANNLELDENGTAKCREFSKTLLRRMSFLSTHDDHFAAVPFQVRMLAEIFQESDTTEGTVNWNGCKEYLTEPQVNLKLPGQMNMAKLYQMFLGKKRSVYVEKGNPYGLPATKMALIKHFDDCLDYQRSLALEALLSKKKRELFKQYRHSNDDLEASVVMMGIVQKVEGEVGFVHRSFAEYLTAQSILMELQRGNEDANFQRLLIDEVLTDEELNVVCGFFDSFLEEVVDDLPPDVFLSYMSLEDQISWDDSEKFCLIHRLSRKGWPSILRLLLKCIDFKAVKDKYVHVTQNYVTENITKYSPGNTLFIMKEIIAEAGVNIINEDRMTPLHLATRYGHLQTARFLLDKGAIIKRDPFFHCQLLWLAVYSNNFEILQLLVSRGIEIWSQKGYTILKEAVNRSRTRIATYLLDFILNSDPLGVRDHFIAYTAAYLGRLDVLERLVGEGLNTNWRITNGESLICGAARGVQISTIGYLVRHGADVNIKDKDGNTALHLVSDKGLVDVARYLVECKAEVNFRNLKGSTPLHIACRSDRLTTAEFLINHLGDVNAKDEHGMTALHYASQNGWLRIVEALVARRDTNVNATDYLGQTALHKAAGRGWLDIVTHLVHHGADTISSDIEGQTALHSAASRDELDTVRFLLGTNANLNVADLKGFMPFHLAALYGRLTTLQYFIERGEDVSAVDAKGRTALHIAVNRCEFAAVECLLQRGMDVNARDKDGRTALHHAARRGHFKITQLLVKFGARFDVRDGEGRVAGDLVDGRRHIRVAKLLKGI